MVCRDRLLCHDEQRITSRTARPKLLVLRVIHGDCILAPRFWTRLLGSDGTRKHEDAFAFTSRVYYIDYSHCEDTCHRCPPANSDASSSTIPLVSRCTNDRGLNAVLLLAGHLIVEHPSLEYLACHIPASYCSWIPTSPMLMSYPVCM